MRAEFSLVHSPQSINEAKVRVRQACLQKSAACVTVGIWSLDAWLGSLAALIEGLNRKQSVFVFYEVEAGVPAGLISQPERVNPWLEDAGEGAKLTSKDNLIANDFFGLADSIRTDLGLDYIVGVTPSMVAGEDDKGYYTDHFSTYDGRTVLASSYDLHDFAKSSGLSFEAFLTAIQAQVQRAAPVLQRARRCQTRMAAGSRWLSGWRRTVPTPARDRGRGRGRGDRGRFCRTSLVAGQL